MGWTLDPDSEDEHLTHWLGDEPDPDVRERVLKYIAEVVREPVRAHLAEHDERTGTPTGVYSARVPGTSVGVIWTLDEGKMVVVLAGVGPI